MSMIVIDWKSVVCRPSPRLFFQCS